MGIQRFARWYDWTASRCLPEARGQVRYKCSLCGWHNPTKLHIELEHLQEALECFTVRIDDSDEEDEEEQRFGGYLQDEITGEIVDQGSRYEDQVQSRREVQGLRDEEEDQVQSGQEDGDQGSRAGEEVHVQFNSRDEHQEFWSSGDENQVQFG